MSKHARNVSEVSKTPHSVSLKVLRLSKPQLSYQYPLPNRTTEALPYIDPKAALSYPTAEHSDAFILSPLLTLPASFGTAHVGETFACTLCANNELPRDESGVSVSGVRISAVMQTPSQGQGVPLDLERPTPNAGGDGTDLAPRGTLPHIVRFDLREEGTHILSVTVTYNETQQMSPGSTTASSGRVRTFRKLYQFVAHQLLSVRTKAERLPQPQGDEQHAPPRYALEAQLENLGDISVAIEDVEMLSKAEYDVKSLNSWDMSISERESHGHRPWLAAGEVMQVCFLLKRRPGEDVPETSQTREGRTVLGQLSIRWRGPMGEKGSVSTGWISSKRRLDAPTPLVS